MRFGKKSTSLVLPLHKWVCPIQLSKWGLIHYCARHLLKKPFVKMALYWVPAFLLFGNTNITEKGQHLPGLDSLEVEITKDLQHLLKIWLERVENGRMLLTCVCVTDHLYVSVVISLLQALVLYQFNSKLQIVICKNYVLKISAPLHRTTIPSRRNNSLNQFASMVYKHPYIAYVSENLQVTGQEFSGHP